MDSLERYVREEASKCMYCGFCEAVCPTRPLGRHRGWGPRGRVLLSLRIAEGAKPGREAVEGVYTCLLCAACHEKCPAGIDIAGVVRAARAIYNRRMMRDA